ncbi:sugar ABC transporter ATP-binding protein [Lacrimispora saccharolytica]|uniref:ABC transporter related protein n=1 Tax=Lacrimispora saccharolytica (strain ATCC 35040 / DSM 2544 / NRCC 2533 / WM1) TaxID=610130 RepID=D9R0L5_LACSW|nr:sugar ABC transporter ATP-binding protein [Lacrimispora saccharolytica]ADL02664.1 ABC transporter related protein [[Clostridium] saccharolyticum WM1]QRV19118.1 sugar ABC transporter ATP-binding protein [Lacrimispora saccharolytica]
MSNYLIELKGVTKRFPGVVAMRNMSLQIRPGEIHGLIGENGAGKSTLIKVLTGVHIPEEGTINIEGNKVSFKNPNDAAAAGIACVYQELNIVKLLSVTDNIFINKALKKKGSPFLEYAKMHEIAHEVMLSLGQDIDVKKECGSYGMGIQQMVEIAKAVLIDAKLIIMDEPTSSLGEKEVEQLMKTVRSLKEKGIAILFVSHKLEELFELCDRVTVMRDGEHILTKNTVELDNDSLIAAMVGRTLDNQYPKVESKTGTEALRVEHLNSAGVLRDVSFHANHGEILGFAGLVGAGRTETFRAVFGADPFDSGDIYVNGKKAAIKSPKDGIQCGMAFLTEDRKGQGLVLSQSVRTNLILSNMRSCVKGLFFDEKQIDQLAEEAISDLKIKTPTADEVVGQLSGGNQQKVVIGKWINTDADIYIFDEPTRGIDVGAKVEVYNIMNRLVLAGKCVIMISSELPEIIGMSDRVIIMREGRVMGELSKKTDVLNQEIIMKAAWGGKI